MRILKPCFENIVFRSKRIGYVLRNLKFRLLVFVILSGVLWDDMRGFPSMPTLVCGDFHSVLGAHERLSSIPPLRAACEDFRSVIADCDLVDIPNPNTGYYSLGLIADI